MAAVIDRLCVCNTKRNVKSLRCKWTVHNTVNSNIIDEVKVRSM